jgi:hypothetical protein
MQLREILSLNKIPEYIIYNSNMNINWIKVSEIALEALLTGIVSAFVVYITFKLGKRQSDINWRREIDRREREKIQKDRAEHMQRRKVLINDLFSWRGRIYYQISEGYYKNSNILLDGNEIAKLVDFVRRARAIYQNVNSNDINDALGKLLEFTKWTLDNSPQDFNDRELFLDSIFNVFDREYKNLEVL